MRGRRHLNVAVAVSLSILGFAPLCAAQSAAPQPLPARQIPLAFDERGSDVPVVTITLEDLKQLDQWTRDFEQWETWAEQWLSRRQVGWWADFADRKQKPDPPPWLSDVCVILAGDPQFTKACELLPRWSEDLGTSRTRLANAAAIKQRENPTKSAWWQHLHVDGLWGTTQSDISAFGLFGMHFTVKVEGRLQVFIAPGILLVSVPGLYGQRQISPAPDWGISYRLFNVGRHTVNFNIVRAFVLVREAGMVNPSMTMAGFSISFLPNHR